MSVRWHPAGGRGRLKALVAERVRERIEPADLAEGSATERRLQVREEALRVLREHRVVLPARELTGLVNEVSDEVVGLGAIEGLLRDPEITEVMVNGPTDVFVERKGRIERVESGLFEGEEAVLHLIERIVGPLGLRVDESSPYVDARLPDGSRFHAVLDKHPLRLVASARPGWTRIGRLGQCRPGSMSGSPAT